MREKREEKRQEKGGGKAERKERMKGRKEEKEGRKKTTKAMSSLEPLRLWFVQHQKVSPGPQTCSPVW